MLPPYRHIYSKIGPSPHTIRSRILKVFHQPDPEAIREAFTAHDPFEDTESGAIPHCCKSFPSFTAHDPFEDTERPVILARSILLGVLHRTRSVRGY